MKTFFVALSLFLVLHTQVYAQSVTVRVRAIKAFAASAADFTGTSRENAVLVDPNLGDVKSQLSSLPYKRFKLVATEQAVLALKQRQTLSLPSNHEIMLRPLYMQDHKVGLWLKWLDGSGKEVLDTRLHFDSDESMLAGTDSAGDSAMILAIDVKPAPR